jgi:hypothetical protein
MAEATKAKRQRTKAEFRIQRETTVKLSGGTEVTSGTQSWVEAEEFLDIDRNLVFEDTTAAMKHIQEKELTGKLRIIRVCKELSATIATKRKVIFS